MDRLIINGGIPLKGKVRTGGSKNAALPILLASILLDSSAVFTNIPVLRDIQTTIKLLGMIGRPATFTDGHVHVAIANLIPEAPYDLVRTMRASVLVLGPLLACLGRAKVAMPGGCAIGARPVNLHLSALEKMGAHFDLEEGYITGQCARLHGAQIHFDFPTVGGTENLLMAAVLADGDTVLENAAHEPEIVDLANFLIACGAKIEGHGSSEIHIHGVSSLHGTEYRVMPDRIEAATFLAAAGITDGDLIIEECPAEALDAVIAKMRQMGMQIDSIANGVHAKRVISGQPLQAVDLTTRPYPGFPTDMQAQMMAMMSLADGSATITETIFENRFMHVQELVRMGANVQLSGHTAIVRGVKRLTGAPVMASDLRASASLVLAGLAADGTTEIQRIYHLDRGYENIEKKLGAVGAAIRRVSD